MTWLLRRKKDFFDTPLYVSHGLNLIFFLAGYIERKCEPKEKDVKSIKSQIVKIKETEGLL